MAFIHLYRAGIRLFRNLYFLMFLNGFLIASLFYFKMQDTYENGLFSSIKSAIDTHVDANDNKDSIVVKAMNECYSLMKDRESIFSNRASLGAHADFFHATSVDLMTTRGACGSYSQVLARILSGYDLPVRIAQMKANGTFGAHNIVEVNTGNHWAVLDPTFNTCFVKPTGGLASFDDVKKNWAWYSRQVPAGYDMQYRYEDARYSNWTRIPLVLPTIKGILNLSIGNEKANHLSIRTWFLRIYNTYFYLALLLLIPLLLFTLRRLIQLKIFPDQDMPFTLRNLVKYSASLLSGNKPSAIR